MENPIRFRSYTLSSIFLVAFGVFQLIVPLLVSYKQPKLIMSSDFLMDFYPAGKLITAQRISELYHCTEKSSFISSAFNHFVHQILPALPKEQTAIFMYSPLTALVFYPYSLVSPQIALILWQGTSIIAFVLSIILTSTATRQDFKKCFGHSLLYLAVFQTVLIGQLGIVLGLLPLAVGYFFLRRGYHFLAGFCWATLLLKPQFLPIPLLITGALALNKKFRCSLGFSIGLTTLVLITVLYFDSSLLFQWISSLKISDTIFSDARYSYPFYLVVSMPAAILHLFPISSRDFIKIPIYIFSFMLSLQALWLSSNLFKNDFNRALSSVFVIGITLLPLILPHFLFYDFSVFALLAVLLRSPIWSEKQSLRLKILDWFYLISIDVYYILLSSPIHNLLQPIVLVSIMAFLYHRLLKIIRNDITPPRLEAANESP